MTSPLQTAGYLVLGASSVWFFKRAHYVYFTLTDIPTIGPSGFFSTFWGIKQYVTNPIPLLDEGYSKFPGMAFKVYTQNGWEIFISGEQLVGDIQKAKDDVLSFIDNALDLTQAEYQVPDPEMAKDFYHTQVVKTTLTRNIAARFEDVRDEINTACAENMHCGDDWVPVTVLPAMMRIISRGANRFFLGLDFCRNQDLLDIFVDFTVRHIVNGMMLKYLPKSLRRPVARFILRSDSHHAKATKYLEPTIRYRLEQEEKYGRDWEGKPNDYISWILSIAAGPQRDVYDIIYRIISINFAAIHTTSHSLTHALFDLAANPQYIQPLRDEIEGIIAEEGWSKASMQKMKRLDSFAKESQRYWGIASVTSGRRVMKPFTFSNGQSIPVGSDIQVTSRAIHRDNENYEAANEFRPWRFSDMRKEDGEGVFHQFVTPDRSFVAFGVPGKHSCPGRFFAATEIKQALAYFVTQYDFKFEDGVRPPNIAMGPAVSPNGKAKMLFRKRQK